MSRRRGEVEPAAAGAGAVAPRTGRAHLLRWTLVLWAWVTALMALWALATPAWTPPDSVAHHTRAWSAAHGQVVLEDPGLVEGLPYATLGVSKVPQGLLASALSVSCYTFKPDQSAACIAPVTDDPTPVEYLNPLGQNLPVYYVVTGLPSLLVDLPDAVTADTAIALLLAALFVAWALSAARGMRRPALATTGVVVACSPMVLYFGAVLNPNSVEITAAMAMGACSLAFLTGPEGPWGRAMLRRAAIAATVMALTRMLSPVWILCWAAFLVVAFGRPGLRTLLARRNLPWLALPVAGTLVDVAWTALRVGAIEGREPVADLTLAEAWRESMNQIDSISLGQAVGVFGWTDTPLRAGLTHYYVIGAVLVIGAAWLFLSRRGAVALALLGVLTYLVPIGLQALQWNANGAVWQMRYTLPLLVLVPVAATFLAAQSPDLDARLWSRAQIVMPGVLAVLAYVHVGAYLTLLRRNVDGLAGDTFSGDWSPPLGAVPLAVLLVAAVVGTWLALVRTYWRQEPVDATV